LMEVELDFTKEGVGVDQAQLDFIISDCMTVVAGRFISPVGWFTERMHPAWINKLPDFPLMFKQAVPGDYSLDGVQVRGGKYLFCTPVKMEYALFVSNGFGLPEDPKANDVFDLAAIKESTGALNPSVAYGGRLGFQIPEIGVMGGISGLVSKPYSSDG